MPLRFASEDMDGWEPKKIDAYEEGESKKKTLSLEELLQQQPQVVVLGGPGCGKTTLTRWLAWALSADPLTPVAETLGLRIVLPFILRNYIGVIDAAGKDEPEALLEAYCQDFNDKGKKSERGLKVTKEQFLFYL